MKKYLITGLLLFTIGFSVIGELYCRSYLNARFHGSDPYSFYYPKIRAIKAIHYSSDTLKIGIFGSSVTAGEIITQSLEAEIQNNIGQPVRVYNFSYIGGTLQDAWYMYKWAKERKFWGVIIYHGVGEMRMNRYLDKKTNEYASNSWFKRRQDVDRYYSPLFQTPCALAYVFSTWLEKQGMLATRWNLGDSDFTSKYLPATNVVIEPFSKTYREFLDLADKRNERVFAGGLTFSDSLRSALFEGLACEYNDSMRAVTCNYGTFVDFSTITNRYELFSDFYHFNEEGQLQFAHILAQKIIPEIKDKPQRATQ